MSCLTVIRQSSHPQPTSKCTRAIGPLANAIYTFLPFFLTKARGLRKHDFISAVSDEVHTVNSNDNGYRDPDRPVEFRLFSLRFQVLFAGHTESTLTKFHSRELLTAALTIVPTNGIIFQGHCATCFDWKYPTELKDDSSAKVPKAQPSKAPKAQTLKAQTWKAPKAQTWEALRAGDLVDVVAPGWACKAELIEPARQLLQSWGLRVRIPEGLLEPWTFFANSDEKRGRFLHQALHARDSKAVWCLRAASGTHRVLPLIFSRAKPKRPPKLVIGFSDITALHAALIRHWAWPSLHGPMLDRLAQHNLSLDIVEKLRSVVFGESFELKFDGLKPQNLKARRASLIRGSILGGNLTVFENLIGTRYMPKTQGRILFFEDVGERGYRLDRSFVHLAQAGLFVGVRAIVIGQLTGGDEPVEPGEIGNEKGKKNLVDVAVQNLAEMVKIPVFRGLPVGHGELQWPLPLGTEAVIEANYARGDLAAHATLRVRTGGKRGRQGTKSVCGGAEGTDLASSASPQSHG
ncbi:MAG: hypothetical protein C5B49_14785 [Bdellovibrio sp.]|nr:MAG: hypothetical protein C5B49_14785 [Bdellovibrio sp.]